MTVADSTLTLPAKVVTAPGATVTMPGKTVTAVIECEAKKTGWFSGFIPGF